MLQSSRYRRFIAGLAVVGVFSFNICDAVAQSAPTPPMGWNPWNAFRTEVDEARIMANAQALMDTGLADAGYRYANIDDGWWLRRDPDGEIRIRASIFPSAAMPDGSTSLRPFVDRVHAMGLKTGLYTDIGRNNCAQHWDRDSPNLPEGNQREREVGTMGYQAQDARLFFSDWNLDYVKVDACGLADYGPAFAGVRDGTYRKLAPLIDRRNAANSEAPIVEALYAGFAREVRRFSPEALLEICAWGEADSGNWAGRYGNLWRTSPDIRGTWEAMLANFDSAAPRSLFAGPGHWNHPDMLEVGNGVFGPADLVEARAHMSMWAVIAAPLILGVDLTKVAPEIIDILGNRDVLAISQDPAGHQGVVLAQSAKGTVIARPLAEPGRKAVALINRTDEPLVLGVDVSHLHFDPAAGVDVRDVWRAEGRHVAGGRIEAQLAAHETVLLLVSGQPAEPRVMFPADMPARFDVAESGILPAAPGLRKIWVPARIGYLPSGAPIEVNGQRDFAALGVGSGSRLRFALDGEFRRLATLPVGAGRYAIYGDGKLVHAAGAEDAQPVQIDVAGLQTLDFVAPATRLEADTFVWSGFRLER